MLAVRRDVTDADGRFSVPHLTEGTYAVAVQGERHVRLVAQWIQPNQPLITDFFVDGTNPPAPVRIEAGGSGRVEGHVKADDMENFTQTWVQIPELNNAVNARADATGFYVFENVPVGSPMRLKTWMPAAESEPFTVEAGETKTIDLVSEGAPHFVGTVLGANGKPVVGAYVKAAMANNARNEFRQILQNSGWGTSRTDAEGKFAIRLQGWQLQQASAQKWLIAAVSYEYPLQVTKDVAIPKDGTSANVQIILQPGGTISGTVEFEGRGPLANARVTVSPKSANPTERRSDTRVGRYVYTDLAGRFTVEGIGEGDWTVTTTHPDGAVARQDATAGTQDVQLVITPTLAISGIVVDEDDRPLARVRVSAIIPNGKNESRRTTNTDASGRFRIAQLEPGDYELEVTPGRNQQMYYGGAQQAGGFKKTRTRAYPAGTESIVIEVEPGNKIAGVVQTENGSPVGGAAVLALPVQQQKSKQSRRSPRQSQAQSVPTTYANGRGEFTLKGVGEGQYEIVAIATGYVIASAEASVGQDNVVVTMGTGATLEGVLLAPDGKPIGGQWINLQSQDPEYQQKLARWSQRGGNAWNNIGGWQANANDHQARRQLQGNRPPPREVQAQHLHAARSRPEHRAAHGRRQDHRPAHRGHVGVGRGRGRSGVGSRGAQRTALHQRERERSVEERARRLGRQLRTEGAAGGLGAHPGLGGQRVPRHIDGSAGGRHGRPHRAEEARTAEAEVGTIAPCGVCSFWSRRPAWSPCCSGCSRRARPGASGPIIVRTAPPRTSRSPRPLARGTRSDAWRERAFERRRSLSHPRARPRAHGPRRTKRRLRRGRSRRVATAPQRCVDRPLRNQCGG